jgi:hypothetical protein
VPLNSGQKTVISIIGLLILYYVFVARGEGTHLGGSNTPEPTKIRSAEPTEVVRLTAQEIFNAYEANEVATDNVLKDTSSKSAVLSSR